MQKTKCDLFRWNILVYIFGIIGVLHIMGISFWSRSGWSNPTIKEGIFWLLLSAVFYLFIKYFCTKANVVKCTSCGEIFSETDTQYDNCPKCNGVLTDVKKYYDKSKS